MLTGIQVVVAAVLVLSAAAKLAAPRRSRDALVSFGLAGAAARRTAWVAGIVAEFACATAVIVVPEAGLFAAAVLLYVFAALLVRGLATGAGGRPCGCFGARGTISPRAALADGALGTLALAGGIGAAGGITTQQALAVVLAVVCLAVAALGVAVVALAREIGVLRLALGARAGALEIADEGPPVGGLHDAGPWLAGRPEAELAVLVFTSAGCPMCRTLGPALAFLRQDPRLAVAEVDEELRRDAWTAFAVPGSPYAVVLSGDGTVLAKGTFNGLPQLESVVATAVRRRGEVAVAA